MKQAVLYYGAACLSFPCAFHCHHLCFLSLTCPGTGLPVTLLFQDRIVVGQHSTTVSLLQETTNLLKTPKEPKLCLLSTQPCSFRVICSRVLGA